MLDCHWQSLIYIRFATLRMTGAVKNCQLFDKFQFVSLWLTNNGEWKMENGELWCRLRRLILFICVSKYHHSQFSILNYQFSIRTLFDKSEFVGKNDTGHNQDAQRVATVMLDLETGAAGR